MFRNGLYPNDLQDICKIFHFSFRWNGGFGD